MGVDEITQFAALAVLGILLVMFLVPPIVLAAPHDTNGSNRRR